MSIQTDIHRNKLMHLENTLVIYGIYNAETLEGLVKTVHALHSRQTLYKNLFTGRTSAALVIIHNVQQMRYTTLCN